MRFAFLSALMLLATGCATPDTMLRHLGDDRIEIRAGPDASQGRVFAEADKACNSPTVLLSREPASDNLEVVVFTFRCMRPYTPRYQY